MVDKLFEGLHRIDHLRVLDPGCGEGEFIAGVIRFCKQRGVPMPHVTGVELDPCRATKARGRFSHIAEVEIRETDFLSGFDEQFDLIVGNPPYVSILALSVFERDDYRRRFSTASGRFDLYVLFFEQALRHLADGGRLVFITPEKYLYVESARPLRELLLARQVSELHFASEDTFGKLVTYPLITTVFADQSVSPTRIVARDGARSTARLSGSASWLPQVNGQLAPTEGLVLGDIALRVSCGVATGADSVYIVRSCDLGEDLRPFSHPTVSGRQISSGREVRSDRVLLAPYDKSGRLLPEEELGALGRFLNEPTRRDRLDRRTCTSRKKWFAYHDNLPLVDMLRPKLLCKDITEEPFFILDEGGTIVPRHSVYYIVPKDPADLLPLHSYLNSEKAVSWIRANCQRASKGFLRMQSHVLKQLPLPDSFVQRARSNGTRSRREALLA